MTEFTINLVPNADGELIYYTGETIKGTLTISLNKEEKCKSLCVILNGKADLLFYESKKTTYYTEVYINCEKVIFGQENRVMKMQPGSYQYEFFFDIPYGLPRSYKQKLTYSIQGILDIQGHSEKKSFKQFELKRHENLNLFPILHLPRTKVVTKHFWRYGFVCCGANNLRLTVTTPRAGYVPGQTIKVHLKLENFSNVNIVYTQVTIRETRLEQYKKKNLKNIKFFNIVKKRVDGVKAGETKEIDCELEIPLNTRLTDFLYSDALAVTHAIRIKTNAEGLIHFNPRFLIPIFIGSEPLIDIHSTQQTVVGIDHPDVRNYLDTEYYGFK